MILKYDCRHFPGDRPCRFHKTEGVKCDDCPHYEPVGTKVLIVKLDAVGDVLRTTAVLHGIKQLYPSSEITWVTRRAALPIFDNNPLVDRVFAYESAELAAVADVETFDIVYNFDASFSSAILASKVRAERKYGYGVNAKGKVFPFTPDAETWFEMGAFDDVKKANTRTYQDHMLALGGIPGTKKDIILALSERERAFAAEFARTHGLDRPGTKIGLNTGASDRWQYKQWTLEGFRSLIAMLLEKTNDTVLLYGGPLEAERNEQLSSIDATRVINMGTDHSLREFFSLIPLCDLFVTGDTLALHAATALGTKVLAYFGPTSEAEIETYGGQITKVHANLDCLCCYKMRCDFDPNCMNSLSPEFMFSHIRRIISSSKP
jgi:heptosyltransferase-2